MVQAKKLSKELKEAEPIAEVAEVKVTPKTKIKEEVTKPESRPTAKAGKHSAKALKEVKAKQIKEARNSEAIKTEPKKTAKPPRTKGERAGKKYREAAKLVDNSKKYDLADAIELAIKTSPVKFDATLEIHIKLNVDPKLADQNIRGVVSLPSGSGKKLTIAAFAEGKDAEAAKKTGADTVGGDDFLADLDKEQIYFDVLITTPTMMPRLAKYARLLGPRGLMPSPKSGTVAADLAKAVTEAKAGRVEYRIDQFGIVHLGIGKLSQGNEKLLANAETVLAAVRTAKPASVKSAFVISVYITTTMGPSIRVEI